MRALSLVLCAPLLAGAAWLMRNDPRVAKGQQEFSAGAYSKAALHFEEALAGDGDPDVLQFNLGTALSEQGRGESDPDEASRLLRLAVVALQSALDADDPTLRMNSYFNLGNTLVLSGDYAAAIKNYKVVLRNDPSDVDAQYNLELALLLRDSELSRDELLTKNGQAGTGDPSDAGGGGQEPGLEGREQGQGGSGANSGQGHGSGDTTAKSERGPSQGRTMMAEPRPMREAESLGRGIREKLDALERRSGELRRGRVLRKTEAMRASRRAGDN